LAQRTIPTISTIPQLAQWQAGLRANIMRVLAPPVPANLSVTSKQGGNYVTWSTVKGADGFELDVSENGDMSNVLSTVALPSSQNTAYFDTVPVQGGSTPKTRYYRVRATAGTVQNPHNVKGVSSSVVSSTAIAPNDTVTASVTTTDNSNRDKINIGAGGGAYREPSFVDLP